MDNADENIEFPKGAAVSGSVSLGGTEVSAGGSVKNIMPMVVLVGAIVVGVWAYKKYGK